MTVAPVGPPSPKHSNARAGWVDVHVVSYRCAMPIIRVEMWEGRSVDQKRRIASELSDALVRIIDCDPTAVRVLIDDYSRENWGVGGMLQVDAED
jgi:4-oxalocrotonate tautomerase